MPAPLPHKRRPRLRTILLLLVLVAVAPAIVVVLGLARAERQREIREATRQAAGAALVLADEEQRAVAVAKGLLAGMARLPAVTGSDGPACGDIARQLVAENPQFANLLAASADGSVFCSARPLAVPVRIGDRAYVREALQTGDYAFDTLLDERSTHRPTLNVAYPVTGSGGVPVGVVAAAIDLVAVSRSTAEMLLPDDATVTVVSADGVVLTRWPDPEQWIGANVSGHAMVRRARAGHQGTMQEVGLDGVDRLYVFDPLSGPPRGRMLLVGIPRAHVVSAIDRNLAFAAISIGIVSLGALGAAWTIGGRYVLRPVDRLSEATQRLAAGDLGARAGPPYARSEIGDLAREFDHMAERLQEVTGQLQLTLASAAEGVCTLDRQGRIAMANAAAARMIGHPPDQIAGRTLHDLVHAAPDHDLRSCPFTAAASGPVGSEEPETWRGQDGRERHVDFLANPVRAPGGETVGVAVFLRDVTDRWALEQELTQAQKVETIGRLTSGVAHDFNNLLTVILGLTEHARRQLSGDSKPVRHDLDGVLDAGKRAAALTQQLLLFSRKDVPSPRVLQLRRSLDDIVPMLRRLVGARVDVVLEPADAGLAIRADAVHLQQIILNLVVNARDAMPQGGRITLATSRAERPEGAFVCLAVTDQGVGMDEATKARIFEPFFTTKATGTGLGLATVARIVRQAHGAIEVETAPGAGTTFRLYFPAAEPEPAEASAAAPPARGNETVLVVEEEPEVRDVMRRTLQEHGYTVLETGSPSEVAEVVRGRASPVDLVLSAAPTDGIAAAAASVGVRAARLAKPFTSEALLGKVREVLDQRP
jgi:two-component system cell cycle sensor histidine kinase/response regulator CckA